MGQKPGTIIGHRKNGMPIRLQAGGSMPPGEPVNPPAPPAPTLPQPPAQQYFTAEQLEAARQQEKDKLYGKLTAQETQLGEFRAALDDLNKKDAAREAEKKRLADEKTALETAAAEEKMTVQQLLEKREKDFAERQTAFEADMLNKQALLKKETEFIQLSGYIQRRVQEEVAKFTIAPEFVDLVTGENEQQVEASITRMQQKTASIVAGKTGDPAAGQAPGTPSLPQGVSPTGFAPAGPLDTLTGTHQPPSAEQLKAMSYAEYAEYRQKSGIANAGNNQGIFGTR